MLEYDWYGKHHGSQGAQQGLILTGFPVPDFEQVDYANLASDQEVELPIEIKKYNLIVMSQSCDLENDKVKNVTFCRLYGLKEYLVESKMSKDQSRSLIDSLNSGRTTNMHLLNKPIDSLGNTDLDDHLIVKFDESVNYPKSLLYERIEKETEEMLLLLPPYREAMAQNYGIFFMRVGSPTNISKASINDYEDIFPASQESKKK